MLVFALSRAGLTRWAVRSATPIAGVAILLMFCGPVANGASPKGGSAAASQAVTVTVPSGDPGAPINEDLTGVNHIAAGSEPALQAIGTSWARTDVSFEITTGAGPAYNCTTGAWNPSYLDSQVANDQAAGASPELIVDYTPPCLATDPPTDVNPNYTPPDIGPDQAKWQALVYQMALHEITAEGVRVFEVWNEPNLGGFWTGGLSGYLTLYQDTSQALEEAATEAGVTIEVGGPALGEFDGLDTSWISALAADAVQNSLPLDFVSWHLYANNPDLGPSDQFPDGLCFTGTPPAGLPCDNPSLTSTLYSQQVQQVKAALASYPSLHPLLWIDEWNINAGEDARANGPYGAAFVAAVLADAQESGIDRMSFFDTVDDASDATQNWGLLFSDLSPKPDYFAMQMWHRLAGSQLPVSVKPAQSGSDSEGIGAVASYAPDGEVNVMVYNFAPYDPTGVNGTTDPTPYDHAVTIKVTGLSHAPYELNRTLIDATHSSTSIGSVSIKGPSSKIQFILAGEGVTLLTLTREPPTVTKVRSPTGPGAGGNKVTISGSALGGTTSVAFGNVPATNISVNGSGTRITAYAPTQAAGTVDVSVTTPWGTSATSTSDDYTYLCPSVTKISPKTGSGGTKVTISGQNLQGASAVAFGGSPAQTFTVNATGTRMTAFAPPESAGTVDIQVTTPGGTTTTGNTAGQFTYS